MATPAPNVLNFTGERFAPEVRGAIWYEHWHRYCIAQPLATGLSVLDAACGEGYGSYLLAQTAKEVVGIDIAAEAIEHAQSRYVAPNLRYVEGSCTALPLADGSVDLVISFETIEHLQQQSEMVAEFRRVLAPNGVLVISSPNPAVYSEKLGARNEYHVRELTRKELTALLKPAFPQQAWYGQRVIAHSALWVEKPGRNASPECSLIGLVGDEIRTQDEPAPPMYFIVVCGAKGARLPALPSLSLFDDGKQSLYNDYGRALIREKELYWQELDARKIAEDRLGELIAATNDLASLRQEASGLKSRLSVLEDAFDTTKAELETERQFNNSLTWEERNARNVAEARLGELITHVNNFHSERARAEALASQITLLQEEVRLAQAAVTEERQNQAAVEWEERNSRKIAEERLTELITVTNVNRQKISALEWEERNAKNVAEQRLNELLAANQTVSVERDKTARLEGEVASLQNARDVLRIELETARVELVKEQTARVAAEWEQRDAAKVGNDRLQQLIETVNLLNSEREKSGTLADRITFYEGALTTAQTDLGEVRSYLSSAYADLESSRGQLASLQTELSKANAEIAALGDAYTRKATEFNEIEAELTARRVELADAREQLQVAGTQLADTYRQLESAHAEWHKLHAELMAMTTARDAALAERAAALAERDSANAQRDAAAVEIGNAHAARDDARAAFEAAHAERDAAFAERGAAFAERGAALAERDGALAERDGALAERAAALAERDSANAQRDVAAVEIGNAHAARDDARVAFEAAHAERDAAHAGWNGAFIERNAALAERDGVLANFNAACAELASVNAALQATIGELAMTQDTLSGTRAELATMLAALSATRAELGAKGAELESAFTELNERDAELESRRADLRDAHTELASLRPQFGRALLDIAIFRAELTGTKGDLETAEAEIQVRDNMLNEVRSRLRFRETLGGWLRWPFARLKGSVRRSA